MWEVGGGEVLPAVAPSLVSGGFLCMLYVRSTVEGRFLKDAVPPLSPPAAENTMWRRRQGSG